jgi:hypothetical protein
LENFGQESYLMKKYYDVNNIFDEGFYKEHDIPPSSFANIVRGLLPEITRHEIISMYEYPKNYMKED